MEAEGKRCGVFGLCMSAYEIARGELSGDERPGSGSDDLVDASSVAMSHVKESHAVSAVERANMRVLQF